MAQTINSGPIPSASVDLAISLQRSGQVTEAVSVYRAVLADDRRNFGALINFARLRIQQGEGELAIKLLKRAVRERPEDAESHDLLGVTLGAMARGAEALRELELAVAARPDFAEAHHHRGVALQLLNRHEEAIASYRRAVALAPEGAEIWSSLGQALEETGHAEEAAQAFERAVLLAPTSGRYYHQLSEHRRFAEDDPLLARMTELARDPSAEPREERAALLFAFAKALSDLGDKQRSFQTLLAANAARRERVTYDEATALGCFDRIAAVFTPAVMSRQARQDSSAAAAIPRPVFIIGMPRSGTTLVEQILASHPSVFGAGELPDLADIVSRAGGAPGSATEYPEFVPTLSGGQLRRLGLDYVAAIKRLAPHASRIVDKMPANFRYAGLIPLILPQARIIHCRRDPVDTCLSCFSHLFHEGQAFAYDLGELGRYYCGYRRVMDHWRAVLPAGLMIEVDYEAVVADLATQARRIVAHCGLEWAEACLSFERTERPIRTASAAQVRRPIYATAIGRGQAYGNLLDPLLDALEPVLTSAGNPAPTP